MPKGRLFASLRKVVESGFVYLQRKGNVDRTSKTKGRFMKGRQWIDITHKFALYLINVMNTTYRKTYRHTRRSDEIFV